MNNQESKTINFPITYNVLIEETINTVYYLENMSHFKQDISSLNRSSFKENGIIVIYDDYIRIENSLFTQNLSFDIISDIASEEANVWSILLENNEKIMLNFDSSASDLELIYSKLNYKINYQERILHKVMCNIRFNRNLLSSLGNFVKMCGIIDNSIVINEFVTLNLFETHLYIVSNNLELDIPYDYCKKLKQFSDSLDLIFVDNTDILIKDMPINDLSEIVRIINGKIYNSPVNNNYNQSSMTPAVHSNNSPQTQPPRVEQQNYNQYSNGRTVPPINQKSKIVGLILNMLVVGLGYAYVGKWGEGIILFITYTILIFFGIVLAIFGIGLLFLLIALILWLYSLIKTNDMIDKYNQGLPY